MSFARATIFALTCGILGCSSSPSDSQAAAATSGGDAGDAGEETTTLHPNAPPLPGQTECTVVIRKGIVIPDRDHVPLCSPVVYPTNPPCGGPHWPVWAAFEEYTIPVPREMYVHDMEHGAVVLLYDCTDACPAVVSALDHVFTTTPADPECVGMGANARMVMTPDSALATPIAAGAWGSTYTATCIDEPSLTSFIAEAHGHGPEDFCTPGLDVSNGDTGCDGGT